MASAQVYNRLPGLSGLIASYSILFLSVLTDISVVQKMLVYKYDTPSRVGWQIPDSYKNASSLKSITDKL